MDVLSPEAAAAVQAFCAQTARAEVFARPSPELASLARTVAKALFEYGVVRAWQSSAGATEAQLHVEGFDSEQIWAQLEAYLGLLLGKVRAPLADLAKRHSGLRLIDEETETQLTELTAARPLVEGTEEVEGSFDGEWSGESEELGEGSVGHVENEELEPETRRLESHNREHEEPLKSIEDGFLRLVDMERFVQEAEGAAGEESGVESSFGEEREASDAGEEDEADSEEEDTELARMLEARSEQEVGRSGNRRWRGDQDEEEDEEDDIMYADIFEDGRRRDWADQGQEEEEEEQVMEEPDGERKESKVATAAAEGQHIISDDEKLEGAGEQPGLQKESIWAKGDGSKEAQSAHERRVARMAERARALEAQNLVEKDWFMRGEAGVAQRPLNSALEVDVDFERAIAPPPQPTEESTASLEDMIKERITERQFDDPPRVMLPIPEAPRAVLELDNKKSQQGLEELYEEEYVRRAAGNAAEDKDEKVRAEALGLLKALFGKLNVLSHFHYVPRPLVADLAVRPEVPALALEEVTPQVVSEAAQQLPEEVYKPPPKGTSNAEAELSHEDRVRRRAAKKRAAKKYRAQKEAEVSTEVIFKGRRSATAEDVALVANISSRTAAKERKRRGPSEEAGQKRRVDYTNSVAVFAQLQDTKEAKPAKRTRAGADSGSRAFQL